MYYPQKWDVVEWAGEHDSLNEHTESMIVLGVFTSLNGTNLAAVEIRDLRFGTIYDVVGWDVIREVN